jgi:hypothetical protein
MSELQSRPSRRVREQRAYRFGLATASFGVIAIVGLVLAVVGLIGAGLPVLAAIIALVCGLMFRRNVGG